jgi:hypothetical protein
MTEGNILHLSLKKDAAFVLIDNEFVLDLSAQ